MIGTIIFGACSLILTSYILNIGIPLVDAYSAIILALEVSLVIGVLNITVKPVLKIVTIPFHLLSLGLFAFIINGFIMYLTSVILSDFKIPTFLQDIYFALIFTFLMKIYHLLAQDDD